MEIVVDLPPTLLESYLEKAQAAHERGDVRSASKYYSRALMIDPDCVGALNNLAMILVEAGHDTAAAAIAKRAVSQSPNETYLRANHAAISIKNEDYEGAAAVFEQLVQEYPREQRFWQDLALAYKPTDPRRALEYSKKAAVLAPNDPFALLNLGIQHLVVQEWDEGFRIWRRSGLYTAAGSAPSAFPEWQGEPLEGKTIIVYHEQGIGDTIQFCRFLRLLEAERILLAVPGPLVRLMELAEVADEVIDFAAPMPEGVDYQVPLMFAWAYRSIGEHLECLPSIKVPKHGPRIHRAEHTIMMVGICWAGNPAYGTDKLRSMPFEKLIPLASLPGVQVVSLQKSDRSVDVVENGAGSFVLDLSSQIGDVADVAYIIDKLDLVVSVDTAPLHLAGTMGKPTIAMLPYNRCWRWGHDTAVTPFYPSMRLFSQPVPKDWDSVVTRVREAIIEMIGDRRVPPEPQSDYQLLNVPGKEL